MKKNLLQSALIICLAVACQKPALKTADYTSFADDVAFLQKHTPVIVLETKSKKAKLAITPDLQGRIMTSTASGPEGPSFGWINRGLISSGENNLHINAYGGEDRFWLGPEGSQYALYFKKGDPFDLEHWYTPPPINEGPYEVTKQDQNSVSFQKSMQITNYAGFAFQLNMERQVRLLHRREMADLLGTEIAQTLDWVAFESKNTITNTGSAAWKAETGLLSIWILGMFNPSPTSTVVVPFVSGPESELGPVAVSDYFGSVPAERLVISDGTIYFKADGLYRSKIGIPRRRVRPVMGSYDSRLQVLTIVQFTVPADAMDYVNSLWKITDRPYGGDVANSYNDGPAAPGAKPMGPFYELESSSPAAALAPGAAMTHVHRTFHIMGAEADLDEVSRSVLGVAVTDIKKALN